MAIESDPGVNIWTNVTTGIYAIVFLFVCYRLRKKILFRSHIGYSVFVTVLATFVGIVLVSINRRIKYLFFVVFLTRSISMTFSFLSVIIAFHKICLEQKYENGKYLAYLAYIWSIVIITTGLLIAVFLGYTPLSYFDDFFFSNGVSFIDYALWGFIVLYIGFFGLFVSSPRGLNRLQNRASISMSAYISCQVFNLVAYTIITNTYLHDYTTIRNTRDSLSLTHAAIIFCLDDLLVVAYILIAALYGHLWTPDFLLESKRSTSAEDEFVQDELNESNQISESCAAINQEVKPDFIKGQTSKPDIAENQRIKPDATI